MLCDNAHDMKLIDSTYNMGEYEFIRGKYKQALFTLISIARATLGSDSAIAIPRLIFYHLLKLSLHI